MSEPEAPQPAYLDGPEGSRLAYHRTAARDPADPRPGLVFCGGFASDMTGTKATALEAYARERGQAFLRFDYRGHGASSGEFAEGTIGRWAADAVAVLDALTEGPQVLIGSSMGGWIMLLAALARPQRVAALVGIAAAPDFTEELMWDRYPPEVRAVLERDGVYHEPSDYGEEPYTVTRELIEDGRRHLLLGGPIALSFPARLIHGLKDEVVPWETSLRLSEALAGDDVEVALVKAGDHRLSEPQDLDRLFDTLTRLTERLSEA